MATSTFIHLSEVARILHSIACVVSSNKKCLKKSNGPCKILEMMYKYANSLTMTFKCFGDSRRHQAPSLQLVSPHSIFGSAHYIVFVCEIVNVRVNSFIASARIQFCFIFTILKKLQILTINIIKFFVSINYFVFIFN